MNIGNYNLDFDDLSSASSLEMWKEVLIKNILITLCIKFLSKIILWATLYNKATDFYTFRSET